MDYRKIKSYEDACKVLGIQSISENAVAAFPKEDRKSMLAYHWKSHATLTPLAKQDCPLWLQYD